MVYLKVLEEMKCEDIKETNNIIDEVKEVDYGCRKMVFFGFKANIIYSKALIKIKRSCLFCMNLSSQEQKSSLVRMTRRSCTNATG